VRGTGLSSREEGGTTWRDRNIEDERERRREKKGEEKKFLQSLGDQ